MWTGWIFAAFELLFAGVLFLLVLQTVVLSQLASAGLSGQLQAWLLPTSGWFGACLNAARRGRARNVSSILLCLSINSVHSHLLCGLCFSSPQDFTLSSVILISITLVLQSWWNWVLKLTNALVYILSEEKICRTSEGGKEGGRDPQADFMCVFSSNLSKVRSWAPIFFFLLALSWGYKRYSWRPFARGRAWRKGSYFCWHGPALLLPILLCGTLQSPNCGAWCRASGQ